MGPRLRGRFITVSLISLVILILYCFYDEIILYYKPIPTNRGFVLNTPGCQIPDWDPFDPSVLHLVEKIKELYNCSRPPEFMKSKPNAVIDVDTNLLNLYYGGKRENFSCTYRPIIRDQGSKNERTDDRYRFGGFHVVKFKVPLKDEFIVVNCSIGNFTNYTQFIPLVPIKPAVERRKSQKPKMPPDDDGLNVILLGIDSISKLNFLRHFQKTYKFLKENLRYFELQGYTKVADNTFPNIVPLLTGHFAEHYWNESNADKFFDDVDFIWRNYSKRGYRTLLAEDAPRMATFNYLKKGFRDPPTDYYFRPFALATEDSLRRRESKVYCLYSTLEIDIMYNYLKDFVKTMGKRPFFAFEFVARLTHDSLNNAGYADDPTFRLLKDLHSEGTFNNSLFILFSDHGIRFGPIRETYIGKFEERMPFIFIFLPPWFLKKHPDFEKNLRDNQYRLTTPFDVHATLVHLLNTTRQPSTELNFKLGILTPHGSSLMDPIYSERSCEDAKILPHWCPCHTRKPVPINDPIVINSAVALMDTLNRLLGPFAKFCAALRFTEILDARFGQANDMGFRFVKHQNVVINRHVGLGKKVNVPVDYMIVVKVEPSGGIFEGTIRYDSDKETYKVLNDISRLNKYGNQSFCINNARIRKFCYCKSLFVS